MRIVLPSDIRAQPEADASRPELGGKGSSLARLSASNLPVPRWICAPASDCDRILAAAAPDAWERERALNVRDHRAVQALSQSLRAAVRGAQIREDEAAELLGAFDRELGPEARVAVRSSAVGEDSASDSFAGQLDTFLEVRRDELLARFLDCLSSVFSERALVYRAMRGHGGARPRIAVVIQQMVQSDISGVLFTANPTTEDRAEAVIMAGYGLGEGIVSGTVEADTFFAELATGRVRERSLALKRTCIAPAPGGTGTIVAPVPEARAARPALEEAQIQQLVALGRSCETLDGRPQDLEWAIDGAGKLHLLQARPITTLGRERETIFDNANIVESYPGLSSPLTFTFVRPAYEKTLRAAARAFGVPEPLIVENHALFENLVALVEGRVYYNILNWYRMYQLVPGFESALPAWEKALGLQRRAVRPAPPPSWRDRLRRVPVKLRVVRRVLHHFRRLPGEVESFVASLDAILADYQKIDLATLDAHALVELNERLGRALYEPYSIALLNDFFAQQFHELLGALIARWKLGDPTALRNGLLCGERGMHSVAPVRSAVRLAARIRGRPELARLFESTLPPEALWDAVQRGDHADVRAEIDAHLAEFGDRTLHELKLETPSLSEKPAFLMAMLRNYVRGEQDIDRMEAHERAIREGAERELAARLRHHPVRRAALRFVLERCRASVKFRENLRLARTRCYGMVKRNYRELARRFVARGLLDAVEDLFFLTQDEVIGAVRGHSVDADLRARVRQRRMEYDSYAQHEPAPRVVTHGLVAAASVPEALPAVPSSQAAVLRGLPCSQGVATGTVKIVLEPRDDVDVRGEILVAPMTDPGWVFLMVAARGIVSERGSLLSHTAIIGRELGIPTVVAVKDATRLLRDGDRVELDGGAGTVRRLESSAP